MQSQVIEQDAVVTDRAHLPGLFQQARATIEVYVRAPQRRAAAEISDMSTEFEAATHAITTGFHRLLLLLGSDRWRGCRLRAGGFGFL
jgi:hypothetical protein